MTKLSEALLADLRSCLGDNIRKQTTDRGEVTIEVAPENIRAVCQTLRTEPSLSFEQLSDLCGVDYLAYGKADWETEDTTNTGFSRGVSQGVYMDNIEMQDRIAVVYQLLSIKHNRRLRVRCFLSGQPAKIASVTDIWAGADWYEREAFDLFGILFEGHLDLRRILTDYGFVGHPMRKDFPLHGNAEVRYDPEQKRVIYQPVSIDNRVLVPKVIRHDNRYTQPQADDE
ncbi:MAG: NADH-quinone oxidoreductase subunit C [Gammaproteobacteria bacterium]